MHGVHQANLRQARHDISLCGLHEPRGPDLSRRFGDCVVTFDRKRNEDASRVESVRPDLQRVRDELTILSGKKLHSIGYPKAQVHYAGPDGRTHEHSV